MRLSSRLFFAAATLATASSAHAADGTWSNLLGGTWSTAGNWSGSTIADGTGAVANFATLDITALRTVTLDSNRSVGSLNFGDAGATGDFGWTLASSNGAVLTLATGTATQPTINLSYSGLTPTNINAALSGTNGFNIVGAAQNYVVFGAGTLAGISGTATITGGRMSLSDNSLGGLTAVDVKSGGQIGLWNAGTYTQDISIAGTGYGETGYAVALRGANVGLSLNLNGTITLTGNAAIGSSGTTYFNNVIGGAFDLSLGDTGANGTNVLNGLNTYSGATKINAGTVVINSIKNVGGGASSLGDVTILANGMISIGTTGTGATLKYTGAGNTTDRVINLAGTTGGATLDQSGSGLLKFTSDFTATGAGIKTLTLTGSTDGAGEISGAIVDNSGTNKTSVTKSGTGTWTLSGTNSYTGATAVNGGTLNLTGSLTSAVTVASGATLSGNGTTTGNITFSSGSTLLVNTDLPGALTGVNVSATGTNVYVVGAPADYSATPLTLINYTGTTPGTAGFATPVGNYRFGAYNDDTTAKKITLAYKAEAKTWNSTTGGTWDVGNSTPWTGGTDTKFYWADSVTFGGTATQTVTLTGSLAPSSVSVTNTTGTLTFSGAGTIIGGGALTKTGGGTLVIANANTYTGGTTISGGTLQIGNGTTVGSVAGPIVNNGALIYSYSNAGGANLKTGITGTGSISATARDIDLAANITGGAISLTQTGGGTLSQGIELAAAITTITGTSISITGDIGKPAAAGNTLNLDTSATNGTITLNASLGRANVWYGLTAFNVNAGTGSINITGTNGNGWAGTPVTLTGAVNITTNVAATNPVTINATAAGTVSGNLSGAMSLTKSGNATLTLSGTNAYTGGTIINGGMLLANNTSGSGLGAGTVAVNVGTLGGTGTISGGTITVANGATLQGGTGSAASGTLTLGSGVTLQDGSIIQLVLGAAGATSTLARTGGTWSFDGDQTFNLINLGAEAGAYTLISGLVGTETGLSTIGTWHNTSGLLGTFSFSSGNVVFTAVPEPSTYGLIGAGALASVVFVRRRRKLAGTIA